MVLPNDYVHPRFRRNPLVFRYGLDDATSSSDPNSLVASATTVGDFIEVDLQNPTASTHLPNAAAIWRAPLVDIFGQEVASISRWEPLQEPSPAVDAVLPADVAVFAGIYGGGSPSSGAGGGWGLTIRANGSANETACIYAPAGTWATAALSTANASVRKVWGGPYPFSDTQTRSWTSQSLEDDGTPVSAAGTVVLQALQDPITEFFWGLGYILGTGSATTVRFQPRLALLTAMKLVTQLAF